MNSINVDLFFLPPTPPSLLPPANRSVWATSVESSILPLAQPSLLSAHLCIF